MRHGANHKRTCSPGTPPTSTILQNGDLPGEQTDMSANREGPPTGEPLLTAGVGDGTATCSWRSPSPFSRSGGGTVTAEGTTNPSAGRVGMAATPGEPPVSNRAASADVVARRTEAISHSGATGSDRERSRALDWGSRGRWFKSSRPDHPSNSGAGMLGATRALTPRLLGPDRRGRRAQRASGRTAPREGERRPSQQPSSLVLVDERQQLIAEAPDPRVTQTPYR